MSFLGIDIGSSRVKAAAFDGAGKVLAAEFREYSCSTPAPGRMELDGRTVLEASLAVIAACAAAVEKSSPVRSLCISSQGEAFSLLDAQDRILSPAMISGDSRAAEVMAEFADRFGADRLYRITGHTASPMFSLAKLLWIRREQPELLKRTRRILCFEDLLGYTLTGRAAMGWPLAGRTMLFDTGTHRWSGEILAEAGIPAELLSEPLPSGTVAGEVRKELAGKLGLQPGTVVVTGGHDQVMGALGCGAFTPGNAMFAAGSVECMAAVLKERILSDGLRKANLCTYDFSLPGLHASLAYSLTGSNMLEYFRKEFGGGGEYSALLAAMPEHPTGLLVLPYLAPSGTPWFDTVTPGCVYGWRFSTSRGALLRGWWEGIAMEMKLNLELLRKNGIAPERLIASGGGFRSPAVIRIHSDVLGLPVHVSAEPETGCRGAALLARRALEPEFEIPAPKIVSVTRPDPADAAVYERKFEQWKQFSQTIRNLARCQ